MIYILFVAFVPSDSLASFQSGQIQRWNQSVTQVQQSSFLEIMTGYNLEYVVGRYAGLILQMRLPKILAMFLLGFYAYRRGFFQNPEAHQPFIRKVLIYGFVLGFLANLAFALLSKSNVLDAKVPGDKAWFRRVERVAKRRRAAFFPVWLTCAETEIRRRKAAPERRARMRDIYLSNISYYQNEFEILRIPHPNALALDTTESLPEQTAQRILEHIKKLR